MLDSYIRDYQIKLLDNVYSDDLERLKGLCYGLEYVINSIEQNIETTEDQYKYNRLVTSLITIKEIIKEEEEKNSIPQF